MIYIQINFLTPQNVGVTVQYTNTLQNLNIQVFKLERATLQPTVTLCFKLK